MAAWRGSMREGLRQSGMQLEVARALGALCAEAGLPPPRSEVLVADVAAVDVALYPPGDDGGEGGGGGGGASSGAGPWRRAGRVAVEVDGPSHERGSSSSSSSSSSGGGGGTGWGTEAPGLGSLTGFKTWVLAGAGWEVARVTGREWAACGGHAGEQRSYLRARLLGTGLAPYVRSLPH